MTQYTLEIGGVSKEFEQVVITRTHPSKSPDSWYAILPKYDGGINDGDSVNIKRDGVSIFKGVVEERSPSMPSKMRVGGRHVKVKLWRKWTERREDPKAGGYFINFYPDKAVQFILRRPKSDDVGAGIWHRIGWGLRPDNWVLSASNTEGGKHVDNVKNRLNTVIWSAGVGDQLNQYFDIDLGSNVTNVCGIRIECRTNNEYIRNYEIRVGTTSPPTSVVASKSNNAAANIFESWTPQTVRYIRIAEDGTGYASDWSISEIYVYQSEGEISGITIDNSNFESHSPLDEAVDQTYMRVTDAVQQIVDLTETGDVKWEWWVDDDGYVYFKSRRGSDKSATVKFEYSSELESTRVKRSSLNKVERIKVLGKGSGRQQDIVSSGWVGSGEYEKVVAFKELKDADACTAKANILLSDLQNPIVTIRCDVLDRYPSGSWGVGDDITLTDSHTGLSGSYRVKKLIRRYSSKGETVTVEASNAWGTVMDKVEELKDDFEKINKGGGGTLDDFYSENPEKIDPTMVYPTGGFSKYWEAETCEYIIRGATTHSKASDGKAIESPSTDATDSEIIRSEEISSIIPAGEYLLLARLLVEDNTSSINLIHFGVWDYGAGAYLDEGTVDVSPDRFPNANVFHTFAGRIKLDESVSNAKIVVKRTVTGVTDFWVDWVALAPAGTAFEQTGLTVIDDDAITSVDTAPAEDVAAESSISEGTATLTGGQWNDTLIDITVPNVDHDLLVVCIHLWNASAGTSIYYRIYNETDFEYYPSSVTANCPRTAISTGDSVALYIFIFKNVKNDVLRLELYPTANITINCRTNCYGRSPHTHDHTEFSPKHGQSGLSDPEHYH